MQLSWDSTNRAFSQHPNLQLLTQNDRWLSAAISALSQHLSPKITLPAPSSRPFHLRHLNSRAEKYQNKLCSQNIMFREHNIAYRQSLVDILPEAFARFRMPLNLIGCTLVSIYQDEIIHIVGRIQLETSVDLRLPLIKR